MRSLRSKLLSACAWAAPILAAALPQARESAGVRPEGPLLGLDLQQTYAQATFAVPCAGCLSQHHTGQDDESLILSFTSHAQDHACGSSNITLNGVYLPQEWSGDFASGSGFFSGVTDLEQNQWFRQRDLGLEWSSLCLHGQDESEAAQLLTLSITSVDGKELTTPSGFTISFKQHASPPSLLRLESTPNFPASINDAAEYWREPPTALRIAAPSDSDDAYNSPSHSLEDDIRELKALQAQLLHIEQEIAAKKRFIRSQIRQQAKSLTEELNHCDGITCILKAVAHKAHGAWRIVTVHFQPAHLPAESMGQPSQVFAQAHRPASQVVTGHHSADLSTSRPVDGPPNESTHELPPRPSRPSPYLVALEVTLGIFCCGCLVALLRQRCASLRTRTDRAAAREERLNAQAYRRAARQHAWRNWWRGNWARRDQQRIMDYEEKQALIQGQESVLEDAMQEEIRQLRAVHDVVNDLVRDAEEGRVLAHPTCTCHHAQTRAPYSPISTTSTYPPTSLPEIPSRPLSRTDSLPSYRSGAPSEPPNYDSEVDMSQAVANGFRRYVCSRTMSEAESHWTPDSSVVDVSPRPSADTLRYPQSIFTCDEEESDEEE